MIQRLFAVGLSLQATVAAAAGDRVLAGIHQAIDDIDETIRDLRSTIFALHARRAGTAGVRDNVIVAVTAPSPFGSTRRGNCRCHEQEFEGGGAAMSASVLSTSAGRGAERGPDAPRHRRTPLRWAVPITLAASLVVLSGASVLAVTAQSAANEAENKQVVTLSAESREASARVAREVDVVRLAALARRP